ncbi:probable E3 ubiquitin-protein ligase HERC4 isoform X2 [Lytechinus pictus]|uniref:probable E3 ubiquitin-protein ligase HERC4 isoform X2 n=1 Tax=Lytechinus pictus TaxID=7653 RepID=UPI0030B9CA8D
MASKHHSGDHDVIMVLRKNSLNGVPIKDACRNAKGIVLTTFKGQVYQCNGDPSTANKQENYDKMVFPTSELEDDPSIDIVNVCCGRQHFLALSADGRVYSWGGNDEGQLGNGIPQKKGTYRARPKPRLIKSVSDVGVVQIACGDYHSLALTRDGRLFSWGSNRHGQLGVCKGNAKREKLLVDKPIEIKSLWGVPLQRIAAGGEHSVFLSVSGSVYVCGWNLHGQLGLQQSDSTCKYVKLPVKLESTCISHGNVKTISCGLHHTSFLTQNGQLVVYGMGVDRVLCASDKWRESELRPNRFSLHKFFSIQSTSQCTYAIEEFTHEIFMLDHSKAQHCDSSQNLELVPLKKALMIDMFETGTSTVWPSPGPYDLDPEVWRLARPEEQLEHVLNLKEQLEGDDAATINRVLRDSDRLEGTATDNHSYSTGSESEIPQSSTCFAATLSSHAGIHPTAATSPANQGTADIPQVKFSEGDETSTVVAHQDLGGNVMKDDLKVEDNDQENQLIPPRILRRLCPGKDIVFIIEQDEPTGEELHVSMTPSIKRIDALSAELLQSLANTEGDITEDMASFKHARAVFSSPACLNASFLQTGPKEINGPNVDLEAARKAFEMIGKNSRLLEKLSKVISVDLCMTPPRSKPHGEALRFILILLECPVFSNPQHPWGRNVLSAMGTFMISLHKSSQSEILGHWWKYEPRSFRRAITAYRVALSFLISAHYMVEKELENFWAYLKVLSFLNEINQQQDILSIKTFYIPKLDRVAFRPEIYKGVSHPLSRFCWTKYPFLMDLEVKTSYFAEVNMIKRECAAGFIPWMPRISMDNRLEVVVSRQDIFGTSVREQFAEMLHFKSLLHRPFKVIFQGEAGIDEGALSMDFFRLAFEELLDPQKHDLVRRIDEDHPVVWFQKDCRDSQLAEIFGLLFGLSLYNKAIVPLPFPQLLYAKLLGKGPKNQLKEVRQLDKDFADQMSKLLDGTDEYIMGCCYGDDLELADGRSVEVTKENVRQSMNIRTRPLIKPSKCSGRYFMPWMMI